MSSGAYEAESDALIKATAECFKRRLGGIYPSVCGRG